MKKEIIGIIVEFNPLHNGHVRLINKAKEKHPEAILIAAMSGSFVQRGELAIFDKHTRAEAAIDNGVDLVIEIPPFFVLNHANIFAHKAVELLNRYGAQTIIFGTESLTIEQIESITDKVINNIETLEALKRKYHSLPKAFEEMFGSDFKSNDTLGICYVLEAKKHNIDVKFERIDRELNEIYTSASDIRKEIKDGSKDTKSIIKNDNYYDLELYSDVVIGKLLTTDNEDNVLSYLKNKAIELKTDSLNELIEQSANKSYTKAKLRRELMKFVLELEGTNQDIILATNANGIDVLRDMEGYSFRHNKENIDNYKVERFISIKSNIDLVEQLSKKMIIKK